jgi:purine catabolism regulator
MNAHDRQLVLTACSLLALQAEQQRRGTAGPRAARACVARLVLAGHLDAARALAAELGMSPLHPRVRVVALSGLTGTTAEEVLDASRRALPRRLQQLVAAADAEEIWAILQPADSASAIAIIDRVRALRAPDARLLVSDQLDVGEISVHRPGIRRSLQEMAPGEERDLARPQDTRLRGTLPRVMLSYTRTDLLGAVVAYLRHRGQWEAAANELGVHRNTLRHRIGTSMRVMNINLDDPDVASTILAHGCGPAARITRGARIARRRDSTQTTLGNLAGRTQCAARPPPPARDHAPRTQPKSMVSCVFGILTDPRALLFFFSFCFSFFFPRPGRAGPRT